MTPKLYIFITALLIFLISCSKDSEDESIEQLDKIAPEVQISIKGADINSTGPIIVDGQLEIQVDASDAGGISKVEAFINNEKVGEDVTTPYEFIIDLTTFISKTSKNSVNSNETLKITVTDKAGNQTSVEKTIIVSNKTPLITITIPEGFLNSFFENVYVFASRMDGKLLENTTVPILHSTRTITLYAPDNFSVGEEFMLTFMSLNPSQEFSFSYATTFQNLTIGNPKEINLKLPDRLKVIEDRTFPAFGFDIESIASGNGSDYRTNLRLSENEWFLETLEPVDSPEKITDKVFLWTYLGGDFTNYHYAFIDRPVPGGFELNLSDFDSEYSDAGTISFTNYAQIPEIKTELTILGYESESDFENNAFHTVWALRTGNYTFPIRYGYYNGFLKYRYRLTMQDFHIEDKGLPLDKYTIPNWNLDPILSNNTVNLNKTGSGHAVGRVILREDAPNYVYDWRIIFNSEKTNTIIIPELPEVFRSTPLGENLTANTIRIHQTELRRYENILTYENYLNTVLKENIDSGEVSEKKEVIFQSEIPVYIQYKDLFFD
jgi:hypothetical protein